MKYYAVGIDHLTINTLKQHGFTCVLHHTLPDGASLEDGFLIVTSEIVPIYDLNSLKEKFPTMTILYQYVGKGVRGYQHIETLCSSIGFHFLSPRATGRTIADKLNVIQNQSEHANGNLIGLFGTGNGIGTTTVAATLAKHLAQKNKKVVLLGLDLYDPGWDFKPKVSLDQWRPRLTGRVLQPNDFDQLIQTDGYFYLPGNFDYIGAQDYQEEEIEFLLKVAKEYADIVIADFGSFPESAAWYVGMQQSNVRYFVSHPHHLYRAQMLLDLIQHLDLYSTDFLMAVNRSTLAGSLAPKQFAQELGMPLALDFSLYPSHMLLGPLPLGKSEQRAIDDHLNSILAHAQPTSSIEKVGQN